MIVDDIENDLDACLMKSATIVLNSAIDPVAR